MKLPHDAWVVVADGEKFLLLRNEGDEPHMNLKVWRHEEIDNPPTHEQGADTPGRFEDAGRGRSAVQQTDWHEIAKERFAKSLADKLRGWALEGRFKKLLLIADPRTLGELREQLHEEAADRLIGELDKDLTNHPLDEIEKAITRA